MKPTNAFGGPGNTGDGNPPLGIVKGRRASFNSLEGTAIAWPEVIAGGNAGGTSGGTSGGNAASSNGAPPAGGAPTRGKVAPGAGPIIAPKASGGSTIALADGWEEDVDPRTSKTFYVNHRIKKWSWNPPAPPVVASIATPVSTTDQADAAPSSNAALSKLSSEVADSEREGPVLHGVSALIAKDASAWISRSPPPALKSKDDWREIADETTSGREPKHEGEAEGMNEHIAQGRAGNNTPGVPPLKLAAVHTPIEGGDVGEGTPAATDPKVLRIEHDREVEELRSDISLIRSQSKEPRRRSQSHLYPDESAQRKTLDSKVHAHSSVASNGKGSPFTTIDISKIRQVPVFVRILRVHGKRRGFSPGAAARHSVFLCPSVCVGVSVSRFLEFCLEGFVCGVFSARHAHIRVPSRSHGISLFSCGSNI